VLKNFDKLFRDVNELHQLLHSRSINEGIVICDVCRQKHERTLRFMSNPVTILERLTNVELMNIQMEVDRIDQPTETTVVTVIDAGVNCSILKPDTVSPPLRYFRPALDRA
jgi:hypothetical protein